MSDTPIRLRKHVKKELDAATARGDIVKMLELQNQLRLIESRIAKKYHHEGGRNGDAEMVWFAETEGFVYEDRWSTATARRALKFLQNLGFTVVDENDRVIERI